MSAGAWGFETLLLLRMNVPTLSREIYDLSVDKKQEKRKQQRARKVVFHIHAENAF